MPGRGNGKPKLMHLLERAYDSAFEPQPFASFLPELSAALGADTAHINVWVPELGGELAVSDGMPEHLIRIYREHHWRTDLWRHALERQKIPVGRAFAGHRIVPYRDLVKSEMYNDALRAYGLFDICGGRIFARRTEGAAVSLMRARGRPFYGRREVARLGAVLPHMARAFEVRLQLGALARQRDAFAAFIDRRDGGAFLVEQDGHVAHATEKARALLRAPEGPLELERGRLKARDAAADRRLQALFAGRDGISRWLRDAMVVELGRSETHPAYRLRILATNFAGGFLALAGTAFLVIVEAAETPPRDAAEHTAARHGLTPAETELLRELVAGTTLAHAAEHLARSLNTARNQLQSIFAKTGTHRQAELIAKALRAQA
jgi:DNA-binding CsgD family transcriptional regulator